VWETEAMIERTERVSARTHPDEKRALAKLARIERRTPSDVLRQLIREEAKRRGLWPPR
jgi:uncharacterized protein (DUF1778 family)